ncbi:MAG: hypothetical protein LBV38_03970 [Alistipes sp.]|jgi:hypothetical protein|nr:hypothetical protein [Alistipes sp.]
MTRPHDKKYETVEGNLEFLAGMGFLQTSLSLNHNSAITFMHVMQDTSGYAGFAGTIVGIVPGMAAAGFLMSAYGFLSTMQWSSYEIQYLNSGRNQGVKIVETYFSGATVPVSVYSITPL